MKRFAVKFTSECNFYVILTKAQVMKKRKGVCSKQLHFGKQFTLDMEKTKTVTLPVTEFILTVHKAVQQSAMGAYLLRSVIMMFHH